MTEPDLWQIYHPDPNGCPALALDNPAWWAYFPFSNAPKVRRQYAKIVNWKTNCFLCPYCGTRVEAGAWSCFACRGRFLGPAGTRCPGHQLEGHTQGSGVVRRHILKEIAASNPLVLEDTP